MEEGIPAKIGRYDVLRFLGRGGQGSVFLGRDPSLERQVAIKVLSPDEGLSVPADDNGAALEGRVASRLRHPNLVSVFDAGNFRGKPFLVFEYVTGQTLHDMLRCSGALSIEDACAMIGPIVDAVASAHAGGITHLDLSPRNIMVDRDGVPRVMDFGLSQFTNMMPERSDYAIGTLRYMAPEHMTGQALGPYTDVFALASTFYEMIAGQPVMNDESALEIMRKLRDETVDLQYILDFPYGKLFAGFLKRAFERDYRVRYCDGAALKQGFERFLKDSGLHEKTAATGADKHSTVEFLLRRMRRNQDFPMMSRTLSDINRLTEEGSTASADHLGQVILRDYALTNKLLKLVNSAYYSGAAGEVTSVSRAIIILGLNQLKMIASSLVYIGQMNRACAELKNSIGKSFFSALIARSLAQHNGLPNAEEAFICGLFQNLGEHLVIYYFPEEYAAICELPGSAATGKAAASEAVLGIGFDELGAAVARIWKLPESIEHSILGSACNDCEGIAARARQLTYIAVFANELSEIAQAVAADDRDTALQSLIGKFEDRLSLSEEYVPKLLSAGMEEVGEHARLFDITVNTCDFLDAMSGWVDCASDAGRRSQASSA